MRVLFVLLLSANIALSQQILISANPDLLLSTANDYGVWGAPEFLYSFTNDYGPIGSPDFLHSVSNEYGLGLSTRITEPSIELIEMPLEVP